MDAVMSRPQKLKFWKEHLRLFEQYSGSQKRYCEENNLHPRNFSLYKTRIKGSKVGRPKKRNAFSEVIVSEQKPTNTMDLPQLPDPIWLAKFIKEWIR